MRIINFKKLETKTEVDYRTITFDFKLRENLDMSVMEFTKLLAEDMGEKLFQAKLEQYKDDSLVIEFRTDLRNVELDPMIPPLLTSFVLGLKLDKKVFKHGEKILGVPQPMSINKGILMDANALDLINYNLPVEKFNIVFYNYKNKAIISLVS